MVVAATVQWMPQQSATPLDAEQRKHLGRRVAVARKQRGWSQARLAEEAGVSENTVMTLESGTRATQAAKVRAVMDVLGLTAGDECLILADGLQDDSKLYLTVAARLLAETTNDDVRARLLARMYPAMLRH